MTLSSSVLALSETPPHARGRQLLNLKSLTQIRNTPACAGKTAMRHRVLMQRREHPRMRGEDRLTRAMELDRIGNTPACAGKTQLIVSGHACI